MSGFASTAFALAILAAFALTGGGLWLILSRRIYLKGALMLVMAAVLAANVLIATV
jgi:hypothetical protein